MLHFQLPKLACFSLFLVVLIGCNWSPSTEESSDAHRVHEDVLVLDSHIDYVVKLVGVDHVGISSDFDGGGKIAGWMDVSETPNVTKELVKRGYNHDDIEKIWGGNLLRVLDAVQAYATQ